MFFPPSLSPSPLQPPVGDVVSQLDDPVSIRVRDRGHPGVVVVEGDGDGGGGDGGDHARGQAGVVVHRRVKQTADVTFVTMVKQLNNDFCPLE